MKRLLLLLLLTLPAQATTLTGTIKYADGTLFNGRILLTLSNPAQDTSDSTVVVPTQVTYNVTNGKLPSTATVVGNDSLQPTNTYYAAAYFNTMGILQMRNVFFITTASFDLGAAVPTSITTNNISFITPMTLNTNQTVSGVKTFSVQWASSVVTGTSPFTVSSTTKVVNLTAAALTSDSVNPAATGVIKLASADTMCWRDNANGANLCLTKSGAVSGGISADTLDLTQFGMMKFKGRIFVTGPIPTCTFTSGGGTSPSCLLSTLSTDSVGILILRTGTGAPAALGTATLTFSATLGTNNSVCMFLPNDIGGVWNARASFHDTTGNPGSEVFKWDNNAIALSVSTDYYVDYQCLAK